MISTARWRSVKRTLCPSLLSDQGFLGTSAPFQADLNLVIQIIMAAALIAGSLLAKCKHYTAHGICQTTVLLLNLLMIGLVMWPSFQQAQPTVHKVLHKSYYTAAARFANALRMFQGTPRNSQEREVMSATIIGFARTCRWRKEKL